ncbi:MAG: molecular chaperone DnaJ [Alphaproteobacteria bacterium]|nr:molecular chaperone DnaJ [Alphaproteobacteria bacterium]
MSLPAFLLGFGLLIAVALTVRWFISADPATLARVVKPAAVVLVIGIGVALVLTANFQLAWAVMVLPFLFWRRLRQSMAMGNMFSSLGGSGRAEGKASQVRTAYLEMTLDHETGVMAGRILQGRNQGADLRDLSLAQILDLLGECRTQDPQSVPLLEAYLDRVHGADWRGSGNEEPSGKVDPRRPGRMSREEAYQVLGVGKGATPEEIRRAHRKLMLANHPDRGGSTYLAAKINQAKDVLLEE